MKLEKIKIAFFISNLTVGGAERVISVLANHWAGKNGNVFIITLGDEALAFPLHQNIEVVQLGLTGLSKNKISGLIQNFKRIKKLKEAFKSISPDIIISFLTENNILAVLATMNLNIPVIISERGNPIIEIPRFPWSILKTPCYNKADSLVLQTKKIGSFYKDYKVNQTIIHNPLKPMEATETLQHDKNIVLSIGRLHEQKNFDHLIKSFAHINKPNWVLWILGEGDRRSELENLIKTLNLENKIKLKGNVSNVVDYLNIAKIFVLSSNYEGYPNALIEAMSVGKAVISTDCNFGPDEIINNHKNGILVPIESEKKLTEAIQYLIENETERDQLGINALAINEKLSLDHIATQWETLIQNIL